MDIQETQPMATLLFLASHIPIVLGQGLKGSRLEGMFREYDLKEFEGNGIGLV